MKRILIFFVVVLLSLSLFGCSSGANPEKVVTDFCEAIKSQDMETASSLFESDVIMQNPYNKQNEDLFTSQIYDYINSSSDKTTYSIGESITDGNKATVPVTFTYLDIGPVISSALGDYISQGLALSLSGADDVQLENLFADILKEKIEIISTANKNTTIDFECVKIDGEWKIREFSDEKEYELTNVLSCNMTKTLESFDGGIQYETNQNYENENVIEDYVLIDVEPGETLELATIKITITGCEELTELTGNFNRSEKAQDGTKYVSLNVEIENITKQTMDFHNDICLYDNQEREYIPYDEAFMYFDEAFNYVELSPNIKVCGNFVYHVPEDAEDYYLFVAKSGTNEVYKLFAK